MDLSPSNVELRLTFVTGDSLTIRCDPDWLRGFVMANKWCSTGTGEDEIWINGAHVSTVTRVKDRS